MKEHPILFSSPMVRAILEDRKTQTRRVVKLNASGRAQLGGRNWHLQDDDVIKACPYGQPGDRLWVRETHAPQSDCWGAWWNWMNGNSTGPKPIIHYAADAAERPFIERWRPSIHMPRWASRITLEITGARVERLQDINEADAKAEGADCLSTANCTAAERSLLDFPLMDDATPYRNGYALLWESINGPNSWGANPWVWCIKFKKVQP